MDATRSTELIESREFLRRLARRLLRDEHAAEDAVQEAYLAALRRDAPPLVSWRSWLAGTVRNLTRMKAREGARRRHREERAARPEAAPASVEAAAGLEAARRVVAAVSALDEPYRTVLVLRFYRDLPPREVAKRMGTPVETVRTRTRRALDRLRARLDETHGGRRESWAPALLLLARRRPLGEIATTAGGVAVKKVAAVIVVLLLAGLWFAVDPERFTAPEAPPDDSAPSAVPPEPDPETAGSARAPAPPETGSDADGREPLPPDDMAIVRLTGSRGDPVAGAKVSLLRDAVDAYPERPEVVAVLETDERGRVRMPVLPRRRYMLKIDHPEYAVTGDIECYGGNVADVRLTEGGVITGVVRDAATGLPVPGATVYAMDYCFVGIFHEWFVRTDGEGRYRIDRVAPGYMNMQAFADGLGFMYPIDPVVVRENETTKVDFALSPAMRLVFEVLCGETGKPVPEASVLWGFQTLVRGPGTNLTVGSLPTNHEYPLLISSPGFASRILWIDPAAIGRSEDPIEVRLPRGIPVRGVVRTTDGSPVEGLQVGLVGAHSETRMEYPVIAVTGSDGTFGATCGLPGGQVRAQLRIPGGELRFIDAALVPEDARELVLEPIVIGTEEIEGTVLDETGLPVRRANLRAMRAGTATILMDAWVDPRGRFRLTGLPEGDVVLVLGAMDGRPDVRMALDRRSTEELIWRLEAGFSIAGRVLDAEGRPVTGVVVAVGDREATTRTRADGGFRFTGLGPGPYRVSLVNRPEQGIGGILGNTFDVELRLVEAGD